MVEGCMNSVEGDSFLKKFLDIDVRKIKIRLRVRAAAGKQDNENVPENDEDLVINNDPYEEFDVDLNDMECLAKDLTKLKPYNEPLVLFRLEQDALINQYVPMTGRKIDVNGMLLIPFHLYEKLESKDEKLKNDNVLNLISNEYRYFRKYQD